MRIFSSASAAAITAMVILLAMPVMAQDRDSDGSRMQARPAALGQTYDDDLSPPSDSADWRMIRLEDRTTITLRLSPRPADATATLILTGSTGNELASERTGRSAATIESTLDAGIYYVAVESSQSLRYELQID